MYKPVGIFFTLFPLILTANVLNEDKSSPKDSSVSDYFQQKRVLEHEILEEEYKEDEQFEKMFAQSEEKKEQPAIQLNIAFALSRALEANRNILGTYEAHERAEINLEINDSYFDFHVTPFTNVGLNGERKHRSKEEKAAEIAAIIEAEKIAAEKKANEPESNDLSVELEKTKKLSKKHKSNSQLNMGGGVTVAKKFKQGTWLSLEPAIYKSGKNYETKIRTVLSQPLLRGFGTEYNMSSIRGAQYLLRTSSRGVYTNQIALCVRTVTQLYTVVKNKESLHLHQASYDRLKGYRDAAKLKEKIGLSDAEDVYRAETALKVAEEALNNVKEQFDDSEDVLKDILAYPLDTKIEVDVPVEYAPISYEIQAAIDTAHKNRIELDQVKDSLSESFRLAKICKDNLWPELNLIISHDNRGNGLYLFDTYPEKNKREKSWNIGFTTSTDLNKQADSLAYDQALVAIGCAQRIIDQTYANITMEVKRSLRQLERIQKRIDLQELQIKTATGELKLAQLKFDRGYADNFNVIQAERNLISARTAYLGAVIDHIMGQYQLLAVLGVLCDKPNI